MEALLTDPLLVLRTVGLLGLFVIIFAESGLLAGFFLPGDSILFAAGLLASQGLFSIEAIIVGTFVAAVLGDAVGYYSGKKWGKKIFNRENTWFFNRSNLEKAQAFYAVHGKKTIILARFVPIVRTFAPILAGVGDMNYRTFVYYNIIGAFTWCLSLPLLGYFLGSKIPHIDAYILPIIAGIVVLSVVPIIVSKLRK